jgi:hypothetical protein
MINNLQNYFSLGFGYSLIFINYNSILIFKNIACSIDFMLAIKKKFNLVLMVEVNEMMVLMRYRFSISVLFIAICL